TPPRLPAALHTQFAGASGPEVAETLAESLTETLTETLAAAWMPAAAEALTQALAQLAPLDARFAVRSSAAGEDGATLSFAGQFESYLNVAPADVAARVVDVWQSGLSPRVLAYRREQGLTGLPPLPAVLVQRMVQPECAGVAFSADPVSGRQSMAVIAAVAGLADGLVAGTVAGDSYTVDRAGAVDVQAQAGAQPLLDAAQAQAIATLARHLADYFGRPQDIEWAWAQSTLYLLQARPITTLAGRADPDGALIIWDNSNIIESYGGTTTPLTYSFARRAYTDVYQTFCQVLGVPAATIQQNQHVFANMIGLVRGRIYYNLLNWYRVLAMLPGFRANRTFMEQMMGVKDGLPPAIVAEIGAATRGDRLRDNLRLVGTLTGLVGSYFGFERRKRRFLARLAHTLGAARPDLAHWRADELAVYYRQLEADLLPHWDAPLVNDFFAMIFFGLLRKLCEQWIGDAGATLQNNLLVGEGGMISAEPAQRVQKLAQLAHAVEAGQPGFVAQLAQGILPAAPTDSAHADPAQVNAQQAFMRAYAAYLDRFGDRCMNELKLESPTLFDDPAPLLRAIGQLAQRHAEGASDGSTDARVGVGSTDVQAVRAQAEAQVAAALAKQPLRRRVFAWVLRNARNRVRDRENLRFERTRVFGRARQIFRELGKRLFAADVLAQPRDVFYLQVDEVLGYVEGTTTATALGALAAVRQAEFAEYATLPAPPRRFVTYGAVHAGNDFQATHADGTSAPEQGADSAAQGETRQGVGCCPGVVRGRARVVENPLTAQFDPGDILVAPHTDPSWILIMPLAAGLLVERGSLLSHAAIVARELGIPAVVAIPDVMAWLQDGDLVELDGATGRVQRIGTVPDAPMARTSKT
ncbi:MAG: PEP/pyruvate-binding domain-containing protein, partial [Litorilinea sp.]